MFFTGRVAGASAAPVPTWTNACSADLDIGSCERLTYIAEELSTIDDNTAAVAPSTETVALDSDSLERLDLTWWGIWAVGGLVMTLIVAPYFNKAFRFVK
jgi:hypothetical protein